MKCSYPLHRNFSVLFQMKRLIFYNFFTFFVILKAGRCQNSRTSGTLTNTRILHLMYASHLISDAQFHIAQFSQFMFKINSSLPLTCHSCEAGESVFFMSFWSYCLFISLKVCGNVFNMMQNVRLSKEISFSSQYSSFSSTNLKV